MPTPTKVDGNFFCDSENCGSLLIDLPTVTLRLRARYHMPLWSHKRAKRTPCSIQALEDVRRHPQAGFLNRVPSGNLVRPVKPQAGSVREPEGDPVMVAQPHQPSHELLHVWSP